MAEKVDLRATSKAKVNKKVFVFLGVDPIPGGDWSLGKSGWVTATFGPRQAAGRDPEVLDPNPARPVRDVAPCAANNLAARRLQASLPMAIGWRKDVEAALAETRSAKKPLLLDFSAAPM